MSRSIPSIPSFVATRAVDVPPECKHFASVDGSVPEAAVTWDHHVTGERVNLHAMPSIIDVHALDGVGTTMADTDAIASAAAVLLGGIAAMDSTVAAVLVSASNWCDHLEGDPQLSEEVNRLGRGLHGAVIKRLASADTPVAKSAAFGELAHLVAYAIAAGTPLPFDTSLLDSAEAEARALDEAGRIRRTQHVGIVDLRGQQRTSPDALYARFSCPIGVFVDEHPGSGVRYTVGVNPKSIGEIRSIRPMLAALAAAEFAHGPPALAPRAVPGAENWGGRDCVGGSPWNYGSRLSVDDIVAIVLRTLDECRA